MPIFFGLFPRTNTHLAVFFPEEMQSGAMISLSPSFSSYSNTNLGEMAARVVEEFRAEDDSDGFYDEFYFERSSSKVEFESVKDEGGYVDSGEGEEFEFEFASRDSESSPISADEIFHNGKILPVYPIFNGDLLLLGSNVKSEIENKKEKGAKKIRLPLRTLFIEERETTTTSSSSSSDADDLEGVPEETYCVWRPKSPALKSSSTGCSSKRWKLIDLLHRSRSEGSKDDDVVFSSSPGDSGRKRVTVGKIKETPLFSVKAKSAVALPSLYHRDGGEKRRTYLPYRQDLVGFCSSYSNVLNKKLQHF